MLTADALAQQLDGLVHLDTQRAPDGIDLTVDSIARTTGHGQLDFGGSEHGAAPHEPLTPVLDDPDDDYAWWSLSAGQYLLEFNESLTGEARVTLQPRTELLERGATHPTLHVEALPRVPLSVGGAGLKLKENARVTTIVDADR